MGKIWSLVPPRGLLSLWVDFFYKSDISRISAVQSTRLITISESYTTLAPYNNLNNIKRKQPVSRNIMKAVNNLNS